MNSRNTWRPTALSAKPRLVFEDRRKGGNSLGTRLQMIPLDIYQRVMSPSLYEDTLKHPTCGSVMFVRRGKPVFGAFMFIVGDIKGFRRAGLPTHIASA